MKPVKNLKNIKNNIILVRVDFNISIKNNKIIDDSRIISSLKTINFLQKQGAKIVIAAHLGRPNGKKQKELSLHPIYKVLKKKLKKQNKIKSKNKPVYFCKKLDLKNINNNINKLKSGSVLVLENIRFLKQEQKINTKFSKKFAELFDVFVLESFSVSHRTSLTVTEMQKYLPSYAGYNLTQEIAQLDQVMHFKKTTLIIGGAKSETKLPVIKNLLKKSQYILVGGGIVNTYLKSKKYKIGKSIYSKYNKKFTKADLAILENKKVILPIDLVISDNKHNINIVELKNLKNKKICKRNERILDIGPKTIQLFINNINKSNSIIWNGPLGYIEQEPFNIGSVAIAHAVADLHKKKKKTVIGGGETILLLSQLDVLKKISIVSMGGGAMLKYLAGKKLPAIDALENK